LLDSIRDFYRSIINIAVRIVLKSSQRSTVLVHGEHAK